LYERDFFAWTQDQAAAVRRARQERINAPIDWAHHIQPTNKIKALIFYL
jgi:hypothetical protein